MAADKPRPLLQNSLFTMELLALKKTGFFTFSGFLIFFNIFYYATFQCGRYGIFKKIIEYFFDPEKLKKNTQKLLIIGPNPFITQSSPGQQPTAQN